MTSIPSDFMDAVERSWPLKLAWLCVPYVPITAVAVSLHADDGGSGLIAALPAIVVFGGAALPGQLQAAIARFGAPLPRFIAPLIKALGLLISLALMALAILRDPLGLLTRWTGLTLPLDYWPAYALVLTAALILNLWHWLRQMHDHYVAEAKPTGRLPFPALRS